MASVRLLLQGLLENNDHETAVNNILQGAESYLISVAFARSSGVNLLSDRLNITSPNLSMYIGIANGVTSKQAIEKLLEVGVNPYLIDMGTNQRIYHPKIYAAFKASGEVDVILGSANLTYSGLNENIEASSLITLERAIDRDRVYIEAIETTLLELHTNYPENVFQVVDQNHIEELYLEGRLEDESVKTHAIKRGVSSPSKVKVIPPFQIHRTKVRPVESPIVKPITAGKSRGIVWLSKELSMRDLNIPDGDNTNPTGSMYLKKGLMSDIEQRSYFREDVFSELDWQPDPRPSRGHLERASATFELIIEGISVGNFTLSLTHNSKTDTPTYLQNNAMTQIHWGDARTLIANPKLLGKFMTLYQLDNDEFQISIE